MSKKSMVESTFVAIVAVLIVAIVLGSATTLYLEKMHNDEVEACRLSVIATANLKVEGKPISNIQCPRTELTISRKDALVDGVVNDDLVKRQIAKEIEKCWYKMAGDQKTTPFDQNLLFGRKSICLVCAEIDFSKDLQEDLPVVKDFVKFLEREYSDTSGKDSAMKQFAMISFPKPGEKLSPVVDIYTNKKYYLIFLTFTSPWFVAQDSWHQKIIEKITGGTFGGLEHYKIIEMIAADQLDILKCGYIYN